MEMADNVFLATQLDLTCLRNVVRLMQFFETFEGLANKTKIIVNRIGLEETEISLNKALKRSAAKSIGSCPTTTPPWSNRATTAFRSASRPRDQS